MLVMRWAWRWTGLWALLAALFPAAAFAQSTAPAPASGCNGTVAWTPCDMVFDLAPGENAANAQLRGEFRSPDHRTYLMTGFRDGDRRLVIRFSPTEEGEWDYRLTSNLSRLNGKLGQFTAAASSAPGFVHVANVNHFQTADGKPHLWMSTALDNFCEMPRTQFDQTIARRVQEKFTHLRVTLEPDNDLREAAARVKAMNAQGLIADLTLASVPEDTQAREKYITEIAARFSAMNLTWMGVPAFEKTPHGRAVLKDVGTLLKRLDPYGHPRTSMAEGSSGTLAGDQWETVLSYGTADPNVGAVEHQLYAMPAVNTGIHSARDLWNATMNGEYPASGDGPYMKAWFEFMSGNRYWELEPYFDVDGGRAVALEGVEYIVYVEKPGPVEVTVAKHGYDVNWMNPNTGESVKAKDYKGEHFAGEPPDRTHDWVLHISREGHKESMLRSYKFDSRGGDSEAPPIQLQQVETNPDKTPFEVTAPPAGELSIAHPPQFSLKIKRPSRGTRSLLVEWTGEVIRDGEGYRIVGTGTNGTFAIPRTLADSYPAEMLLRVSVLNAFGKVYEIDRVYRLAP
jgi:Domain of unknown function (DUF5060)/Putative collagen-binding domain of a collagenase